MNFIAFKRQGDLVCKRLIHIGAIVDKVALPVNTRQIHQLLEFKTESRNSVDRFSTLSQALHEQANLPADYDEDQALKLINEVHDIFTILKATIDDLIPKDDNNTPLNDTSASTSSAGRSSQAASANVVKTPKITLPTFTGDVDQWISFKSLFEVTFHHNTNLDPIQKFVYLRKYVSGDPYNLIKSLPLTGPNYMNAWQTLTNFYDNYRRIISFHVNKILDLHQISTSSSTQISKFLVSLVEHVSALEALKQPVEDNNCFLVTCLLRKFDSALRKDFEESRTQDDSEKFPTYSELVNFLRTSSRQLEDASLSLKHSSSKTASQSKTSQPSASRDNKKFSYVSTESRNDCAFCSSTTHTIYRCSSFEALTPQQRLNHVREHKWCVNCLGTSHQSQKCGSKRRCAAMDEQSQARCNKKHHTYLHLGESRSTPRSTRRTSSDSSNSSSSPEAVALSCQTLSSQTSPSSLKTILLGTALVLVKGSNGVLNKVRVLIDNCSQITAISLKTVKRLGLNMKPYEVLINGLANAQIPNALGTVECNIFPRTYESNPIHAEAVVYKYLAQRLPSRPVSQSVIDKLSHLNLADPQFHSPSEVDMLIGADLVGEVMIQGQISNSDIPTCFATKFGWIIVGPALVAEPQPSAESNYSFLTLTHLDKTLQKFWTVEDVPKIVHQDPEDVYCEELFRQTTARNQEGRYVVRLPFRPNAPALGSNRDQALRRYKALEFRLNRDPQLYQAYQEFFAEYLRIGHMKLADTAADYVIPHHAVKKESSSTTKVRAVFDGSSRDSSNRSLNDLLLKGPKLQSEIPEKIMNFRLHSVTLICDVKMMYRMILVHPSHCRYQHIFWRPNKDSPISEYELLTVTYGLTPSAFLAQRSIKQLAQDEGHNFPLAASAILSDLFVDDFLTGQPTVESAIELKSQLIGLLALGGFVLRKWSSNSAAVLADLPPEYCEAAISLTDSQDASVPALGLRCNLKSDAFSYTISEFPEGATVSKRSVLSYVARTFDPLGWLSPLVFWMKHFMQSLWKKKLEWDEPLSSDLSNKWINFTREMPLLANLQLSRFVPALSATTNRLAGFCDASSIGYGVVFYLISVMHDGQVSCKLINAKSRVAPLNPLLTIPRLELCAAVLLVNLYESMLKHLSKFTISSTHFFTDSTIVLHWLKRSPHTLETFVANRISRINELTQGHSVVWSHVDTKINPADAISRGSTPSDLMSSELWFYGPKFLMEDFDSWPINSLPEVEEVPEVKFCYLHCVDNLPNPLILQHISKQSSFSTLIRSLAYAKRFITNFCIKMKAAKTGLTPQYVSGPLSKDELTRSRLLCVEATQKQFFSKEILDIKNGKVPEKLKALSPFIDSSGFLRVGGRLEHSNLPLDTKHPLLIPKESHIAKIICDHFHKINFHAGATSTQASIQRTYWIIGLRTLLRQRIRSCLRCYRFSASPVQPKMADLPKARFSQIRCFTNVGLDYAGPLLIKEHKRRGSRLQKSYICLFVCMSTKAIHLELVTDLTTPTFLDALDRFVARRGLCSEIHSDNGSNFVGASRKLIEVKEFLKSSDSAISAHLANKGIKWSFITPAAPHCGGLWEAGVRSVKRHLYRTLEPHHLTYEEMLTILVKIEAVLNSRPLCKGYNDPNDSLDFLSPGHFIIGAPLTDLPDLDYSDVKLNRLKRWQLLRQLYQSFWTRWSRDYLQSLSPRPKWTSSTAAVKIGDVVLVLGIYHPPRDWPLARITELLPGKDGIPRTARIKLATGSLLTRPVNKLIPLPEP